MYLVIDTETTGLFDFARPADADGQPRMASCAMLLADADLNLIAATAVLIQPDGWEMPAEAERINGLSTRLLAEQGVPAIQVLTHYAAAVERGDVIVAHNAQYDLKMLRAELRRAGLPDLWNETRSLCTMRALVDHCRVPKPNGRGFKWPRLSEAVSGLLGRDHTNAHGCQPDAMVCLDLLRWLKSNAGIPEPLHGPALAA